MKTVGLGSESYGHVAPVGEGGLIAGKAFKVPCTVCDRQCFDYLASLDGYSEGDKVVKIVFPADVCEVCQSIYASTWSMMPQTPEETAKVNLISEHHKRGFGAGLVMGSFEPLERHVYVSASMYKDIMEQQVCRTSTQEKYNILLPLLHKNQQRFTHDPLMQDSYLNLLMHVINLLDKRHNVSVQNCYGLVPMATTRKLTSERMHGRVYGGQFQLNHTPPADGGNGSSGDDYEFHGMLELCEEQERDRIDSIYDWMPSSRKEELLSRCTSNSYHAVRNVPCTHSVSDIMMSGFRQATCCDHARPLPTTTRRLVPYTVTALEYGLDHAIFINHPTSFNGEVTEHTGSMGFNPKAPQTCAAAALPGEDDEDDDEWVAITAGVFNDSRIVEMLEAFDCEGYSWNVALIGEPEPEDVSTCVSTEDNYVAVVDVVKPGRLHLGCRPGDRNAKLRPQVTDAKGNVQIVPDGALCVTLEEQPRRETKIHCPVKPIVKAAFGKIDFGFVWDLVKRLKMGEDLFLHCYHGLHRTYAIAYLVLVCSGCTHREADDYIKLNRRPAWDDCNPTSGNLKRLEAYWCDLMEQKDRLLNQQPAEYADVPIVPRGQGLRRTDSQFESTNMFPSRDGYAVPLPPGLEEYIDECLGCPYYPTPDGPRISSYVDEGDRRVLKHTVRPHEQEYIGEYVQHVMHKELYQAIAAEIMPAEMTSSTTAGVQVGVEISQTQAFSSTVGNLQRGLKERIDQDKGKGPNKLPYDPSDDLKANVDRVIKHLTTRFVKGVRRWRNNNPDLANLTSKKWCDKRTQNAIMQFQQAALECGDDEVICLAYQIKANEALPPNNKAPRPIIACGDVGQVAHLLVLKCMEDLMFGYAFKESNGSYLEVKGLFGDHSIKHLDKHSAVSRVVKRLRRDKKTFIMASDGSAFDSCHTRQGRAVTENKLIGALVEQLKDDVQTSPQFATVTLAHRRSHDIKGKCKSKDVSVFPRKKECQSKVISHPIRESGDRGTSSLNYLTNFVHWTAILVHEEHVERFILNMGTHNEMRMIKCRLTGEEIWYDFFFEGDDSIIGVSFDLAKHPQWISDWNSCGFHMKPEDATEDGFGTFVGYNFAVDEYGCCNDFCPETVRNVSSSQTSCSPAAIHQHQEELVGQAAMWARAVTFAKCQHPLAHYFAAQARGYAPAGKLPGQYDATMAELSYKVYGNPNGSLTASSLEEMFNNAVAGVMEIDDHGRQRSGNSTSQRTLCAVHKWSEQVYADKTSGLLSLVGCKLPIDDVGRVLTIMPKEWIVNKRVPHMEMRLDGPQVVYDH